jgi:pSer/pThr/pTyr-binding forkhead associated (FHA) protein
VSAALNESNSFQITCMVTKGPHKGQSFTFTKSLITIGRGSDNDVVLINDPLVSRNHCHISVSGNEVVIENLSQKNTLIIEGESVQKWKLLDSSFFSIGDSEITLKIDFEARILQQAVPLAPSYSMDREKTNIQVVQSISDQIDKPSTEETNQKQELQELKEKKVSASKKPKLQVAQPQSSPMAQPQNQAPNFPSKPFSQPSSFQTNYPLREASRVSDRPIAFYVILAIVTLAAAFLYLQPQKSSGKKERKPILKYEDEVALQLNSKTEKETEADLRKKYEQRNSAMALRAQENFQKGMREFQMGQYARAQEFLQVVLNLHPGHQIATKYLNLARVRFDEVLKAKLMLGESSYQKHNFKMCASQYQQVMNMLEGRNRDETYRLAESMYNKCQYAIQGIR